MLLELLDPREAVEATLIEVEDRFHVRVLYACESGSRAWGFASADSDYDVRFLYHHPLDWYLSVADRRDVIELPIDHDLDVNGWELRKALQLLRKSNPALLEWLWSPTVYHQDQPFLHSLRELADTCFSPRRCYAHYLHMAEGMWRQYLAGKTSVRLKKYLYVLRSVLACRWIEQFHNRVPVPFGTLVETVLVEAQVRAEVEDLVARKEAGEELSEAPANRILSRYLEDELPRLAQQRPKESSPVSSELLDAFFRRHIGMS